MSETRSVMFWSSVTVALIGGAAFMANEYLVSPIKARHLAALQQTAELDEQLASAKQFLRDTRDLEVQSNASRTQLRDLQHNLPPGSPLAWLPKLVKEKLQSFHLQDASVRVGVSRDVPEVPGYTRMLWTVEVPVAPASDTIRAAMTAILELESIDPFLRVSELAIGPDPSESRRHVATANLALIVPQP